MAASGCDEIVHQPAPERSFRTPWLPLVHAGAEEIGGCAYAWVSIEIGTLFGCNDAACYWRPPRAPQIARDTILLTSRIQSTELATTAQRTQSCALSATVPNASWRNAT